MSKPAQASTPELQEKAATTQQAQEPSMYLVNILNDDFTPYEFVIGMLMGIFHHSQGAAEKLAFQAHTKGMATIGRYSLEIAQSKSKIAMRLARHANHPLMLDVVPENKPTPSGSPSP